MSQIAQDTDAAARKAGEKNILRRGWTPVNPTDRRVIEIGKFAVEEYSNKPRRHHKLVFVKVEKGWSEIVLGVNYKLIIAARNKKEDVFPPPLPPIYEAVVFEYSIIGNKELVSFVPLLRQTP